MNPTEESEPPFPEPWAKHDAYWAAKEARAMAQRQANADAAAAGLPLPYPNPWDRLDPTKLLPEEATPEKIAERVREFRKICRPPTQKRHVLSKILPASSKD